ncbi:NADP-dependent oxidoreductase [Parasphingorhabdus halotolerans]|uniref:NADP-dependent oxidoreductase n=1 Tax=Parasphingorhabdus halotolerans TaxID=2725558 RepID=A0A6H2DQX0_9SPHN|nr:NADP-dependent oxidoreductase [Parasphingorhabdus halotolerans]QJB70161.1 NADP-dependent oxidoreductase [Parasphingorhabdus halotolerans]
MTDNRQWLINGRPRGRGLVDDDFKKVVTQVPECADGHVLVKNEFLGFDPALKGWMENIGGYVAPTEIGEIMRGSGIGEVIESRHEGFAKGDKVMGMLRWQDYAHIHGREIEKIENDDMLTANLSALGTTGVTAYFGLLKHGRPQPGDTLVVSGAAGATGSMVGQIGKIAGCRTIGIAGGKEKCEWLVNEVGYDHAIDYKNEDVRAGLKELCDQSINVFFDNVGGKILNDALAHIAMNARIAICGGISRYETGNLPAGPENYFNLIFKRASMSGFIVSDYASEFPEARKRLRQWISEGKITYKEDIQQGFDNIPNTLKRLFSGQNFGKQMLKLD